MDVDVHIIEQCRGAHGCPNCLRSTTAAASALEQALADIGFDERRLAALGRAGSGGTEDRAPARPLLAHERFRIAISGCPNCCAQPQIRDFGLFAKWQPALAEDLCIGCGACEEACEEQAIAVSEKAILSPERCVGCGACIRVCPTDALATAKTGWTVLVGGKLGRHPRLADTVAEWVTDEEAGALLATAAGFFLEEARPGERFGSLLERAQPEWPRRNGEEPTKVHEHDAKLIRNR